MLSITTSAAKELISVYETQVTREINMIQEGKGPHFDNKNDLSSWKKSHYFSCISEFQKIAQNFDNMLPKGNFERHFETLNALKKF